MKAYLKAFVNLEQDNWTRLLPMAKFAYNNSKNASTGHTLFELNCGYHPRVFFEEDVDPRSRSCSANKLAEELKKTDGNLLSKSTLCIKAVKESS